jgi:hypothetical protein
MAMPVTAVPMPSPVPVVSPSHLFWLEPIDIVPGDDRGIRARSARRREALFRSYRRQRRSLRARSKRGSTRGYSKGEFQKMAPFHDISSLAWSDRRQEFCCVEMNAR